MDGYRHGAYGEISASGDRIPAKSRSAIIYFGTAPVHTVAGGEMNRNKPIVVNSYAEAVRLFGYSEDWASFTLCEAMYVHMVQKGVAPLVLINVLNVEECTDEEQTTTQMTPANGRIIIAAAERVILDSVAITGKEKDADYTIAYDHTTQRITIREAKAGSLGTEELSITYSTMDPAKVTESDIIGATDGEGKNTGLYAIRNVYQDTGYIPFMLLCPGFSHLTTVHAAMLENTRKINGHWDAMFYTDMPIVKDSAAMKLSDAATWKKANGYTNENEKVHFPIIAGTDGRHYHLSVLGAANLQQLLSEQDGIPYKTPSNTECAIIQNLYMGADNDGLRFDDSIINEKLNQHGIASAAFVGGRWALWGAHTAEYDPSEANNINVSETNMMMLYYISNDFQHRRANEVDQPMTMNRLKQIVSEEQTRLDALISTGALLYGRCILNADQSSVSDMVNGDFTFSFNVTTTPLAKSLTALVTWTDDGFATYFTGEGDA